MNFTCHSGGCPGADMTWEIIGEGFHVKTIAYSFEGHTQYGKNRKILTLEELGEGMEHVVEASKTLQRKLEYTPRYVRGLLSRNWFQVKNSEAVFAIGKFVSATIVSGGTGWAVQMAVDNKKSVFVFDQEGNCWNKYDYDQQRFVIIQHIPKLTENFAGIGTREINDNGIKAIQDIFDFNFPNTDK